MYFNFYFSFMKLKKIAALSVAGILGVTGLTLATTSTFAQEKTTSNLIYSIPIERPFFVLINYLKEKILS